MPAAPFVLPKIRALDANMVSQPGALLRFFAAGTTNPLTVYQGADLATPHPIPVVADAGGRFPAIYPPIGVALKYELRDAAGVLIEQADNVPGPFDPAAFSIEYAKELRPTIIKSSSYVVTAADLGTLLIGDTTAGAVSLSLPRASTVAGKSLIVRKTGPGDTTVSIQAFSGDTIAGPLSTGNAFQLTRNGEWVVMIPAAGVWTVLTSAPVPGSVTLDMLSDAISGAYMPAGVVIAWPALHAKVPSGYLYCNGGLISRATYSELFGVIGTTYGAGDGSTTFALPDYRAKFLRGQADGDADDPDRATRTNRGDGVVGDNVGTRQAGRVQSHTHTATGTTASAGAHTHTYSAGNHYAGSTATEAGTDLNNPTTGTTSSAGAHTHTVTVTVAAAGGLQTAPVNVNVRYYIFAGVSAAAGLASSISTLLHGFGDPSDGIGANGDFYVDLAAGRWWGPKAANTWTDNFRATLHGGRNWTFSSDPAVGDPGAGVLRLNNTTPSLATTLVVSETDADTADVAGLLGAWFAAGTNIARGTLTITNPMQPTAWHTYVATGTPSDLGPYRVATLVWQAGTGTFADGAPLAVTYVPAGLAGIAGPPGPNVGLDYQWSTATAGAPAAGRVQVNATVASATVLSITEANRLGVDNAASINTWDDSTNASKGLLRIVDTASPGTIWAEYRVTGAVTDAGAHLTVPVAYVGSAGTLAADAVVAVAFAQAGDQGGGESNTASNLAATGEGLFAQKTGVDLEFKRLAAAATGGVLITSDADQVLFGTTAETVQVFGAAGTYTYTKPDGCRSIRVTCIGGGGNGGACTGVAAMNALGAGGGAGAAAVSLLDATAITTVAVTVGAAGGTSSFGALVSCTGGAAGASLAAGATAVGADGAAGGTATGGNILNMAGGRGGMALRVSGVAGRAGEGGSSYFGGGGAPRWANAAGSPGAAPGAGGSGALANLAGTFAGGAGAPGIVIVEEFY